MLFDFTRIYEFDPGSLTETQAVGLLLAYCLIYVLPLHVIPAARASPNRSRDDPDAIQVRICAVIFSGAICCRATRYLLSNHPEATADYLRLMGFWPLGLEEMLKSLLLTALLFAAPLYEYFLIDGGWKDWLRLTPLRTLWYRDSWPAWRNYVAGPVTEEYLFRAAAVPLLLITGHSMKSTIFLSPLVFGVAHLHHFYEFRVTHPEVSVKAAAARSVLQFSYTYLFGIYATFIFVRTGSLAAAIAIHVLCNSMGLPRVWGFMEPYWCPIEDFSKTPSVQVKLLTAVYYILLFGGVWAFCRGLYPLSYSPMSLANY